VDYRILGPLEAWAGDRRLSLGGPRQRALLAILLLHAGEVVSTDRLIDELWGDRPPATASNAVQVYVSQLRKALEDREAIETRPPGYVIRVGAGELDLGRFEDLVERGRGALAGGRAHDAARLLGAALELWRGPPLADLGFEGFAGAAVLRLEELRVAALEDRIDAELALGRDAELVPELEQMIRERPLRERPRGQLMLALYRAERQAEALEVYQETRRTLVDELGIEPSPALQRLERAILTQDAGLEAPATQAEAPAPGSPGERSILAVPQSDAGAEGLLALAAPLARSQAGREVIAVRLVEPGDPNRLAAATAALQEHRVTLEAAGVSSRVAAFTSRDAARDVVRLATQQDVDLLLVDLPDARVPEELQGVLQEAPCAVGLVALRAGRLPDADAPVLVAFGGADHDWAALELAAWIAGAVGCRLGLVGSAGQAGDGRDASWLLANAALVVQQFANVAAEPHLVAPGAEALAAASEQAALLVLGLSERWRDEGLGPVRSELLAGAAPPVLVVRRGLRPGGLAPRGTLTRFTWSLNV
jgi:DNA-binding SARP family transcriptional activator